MKIEKQKPTDHTWTTLLTPENVEKIIKFIDGNGHTIFDPEGMVEEGIPKEIVEHFTTVHESGHTPKSMIFSDRGDVYKSLKGVYGLGMLQGVARQLNLKGWEYLWGRGFVAREITKALQEWVTVQADGKGVKVKKV